MEVRKPFPAIQNVGLNVRSCPQSSLLLPQERYTLIFKCHFDFKHLTEGGGCHKEVVQSPLYYSLYKTT